MKTEYRWKVELIDRYLEKNSITAEGFCVLCEIKPYTLKRISAQNFNVGVKEWLRICNL